MHLYGSMRINVSGHLEIGGCDTVELARTFGTPLYVMDEALVRSRCREYVAAASALQPAGEVLYACKTFLNLAMCRIIEEEGLGLDVVSGGELYTALVAGFPPERIYFNGNNKSAEELDLALDAGIRAVIVDNLPELSLLNELAARRGKRQDIMIRVTPGVEAHTHEYIRTGQTDSKFGVGVASGQALQAAKTALGMANLRLVGFHCHIGSQIFLLDSYRVTVETMLGFLHDVKQQTGFEAEVLDIGGGLGIRYNADDSPAAISDLGRVVREAMAKGCSALGLTVPRVILEPGRSIVGEAGTTLYTVGTIKDVPGIRRYVSVDGGMTDNPRVALYQAVYEAVVANKATAANRETVSIAGKCCESGDMLIWDAELAPVERGDILAVCATGAYNYSMSSNYNRHTRPACVLVADGDAKVIVARESYADLLRNDRIPDSLAKTPRGSGPRQVAL